jgi:hypothetical protein
MEDDSLRKRLEERAEFFLVIVERAQEVVQQFKQYPPVVPREITLYNTSNISILEIFKQQLERELKEKGYKIPVIRRYKERGYSIDIDNFLKLSNGKPDKYPYYFNDERNFEEPHLDLGDIESLR